MFLTTGDKRKKIIRSTRLIADFAPYWRPEAKRRFAIGWDMAVGEWFMPQLDIFLTDRVIKGKKERIWTQGSCFSFSAENIIYDTPIAYTASHWRDAVPYIDIAIKITVAIPNKFTESRSGVKIFQEGFVTFNVLRPEKINGYRTSRLIVEKENTLSQNDFVKRLIEGGVGQ